MLILDLSLNGVCDWHVDWVRAEPAIEFLGRLRRGAAKFANEEEIQVARLSFLFEMAKEQVAQFETLPSDAVRKSLI